MRDLRARAWLGALIPVAAATTLGAQAPVATPAGDPTVRSDTIYRLAVDPAKYAGESTYILLDDGTVTVEANGRATRTLRSVVQVLTEAGAQAQRERAYTYNPGRQALRVNWVRVLKPDGSVVSPAPTHQQMSDVPAPLVADPVYGEGKVLRMSLSGVEPGTIVDASFTVEDTLPALPGDFFQGWRITPGTRVARSRFVVSAPADMQLRIEERNVPFQPVRRTADGRTTYIWAARDMDRITPEPFAADSNGVVQAVLVGSPLTWQDVGRWYAGLAHDRYGATPTLRARVAAVTVGAKTRMDTIRAIHKWVAQDIRYVGVELGRGGYQPHMPDSVIATGYGDCKDKATLFVAALRSVGIDAAPVLLSSNATADRHMPGAAQFNHEIAVVTEPDGTRRYTDLTAAFLPYGILPPTEGNGFALVVRPDGRVNEVTLPLAAISDDEGEDTITGTLTVDGTFTGHYQGRESGALQMAMRAAFAEPPDSARRASMQDAIARAFFQHGTGDSLVGPPGKDFNAPVVVRMRITARDVLTPAGDVMLLTLPFHGPGALDPSVERQLNESPRRFPIDAARVGGIGVEQQTFRVTIPAGWTAQRPHDVVARSVFGSYEVHYRQEGNDLVVTQLRSAARGIYPPSRIGDLLAWLRARGADTARFIVLKRTGG